MKIITISGLDGSGKSTQIELLKNYLKSQGKTFFYFHAVKFSMGNLIRRLNFRNFRKLSLRESFQEKSVTKANWLQIQLRKIALLVDIFRFKRLLKKLKVDYIVSDRYFYDSVVNINYLENRLSKLFAERFIPQPDLAFYLKVSPPTVMQRERKPDQEIDYLKAKEKIFSDKIKQWNLITVDGEKDKEKISEEIKSKL